MNADFPFPTLRLELEGLKQSVLFGLSRHNVEVQRCVQEAVDRYCSEDNFQAVINTQVKAAIDQATREAVTNYFTYGDGRAAVVAAVKERLEAELKAVPGTGGGDRA